MKALRASSFSLKTTILLVLLYCCHLNKSEANNNKSELEISDHEYQERILNQTDYKHITAAGDSKVNSHQDETILQTLQLLDEGSSQMELGQHSPSHSDIILVVGNTGAGKTTLTHFIAGDDSQLIAYEADEATILIQDLNNRISTSTIVSKTIFPHQLIDPETGTAFFDCPGFSDTRNTTIEIVNSFFLKKVADSARRIKILLIVNYNSLKSGGDRKDFLLLVKHVTEFFKNIDKFRDGIGLVATKVDSTHSEHRIISGMATFLNATKHDLQTVLSGDELLQAGQLIDALLTTAGSGSPTRLTFFRQPNEVGPLSRIHLVQQRKGHIRNVIWNNLQFVRSYSQDFGYTLSPKAHHDIQKLTDAVHDQIYNYFNQLSNALTTHFTATLQLAIAHDFSTATLESTQEQLILLQNASAYFQGLQNQTNFNTIINNHTDTTTFSKFIEAALNHFELINCTSPEIQKGLTHNGDYLDFLQRVTFPSDFGILQIRNMSRRHHWFEPLRNFLSWAEGQERLFCLQLNAKIENSIEKISKSSKTWFIQNFHNLESLGNQTEHLQHLLNTLRDMASLDFDTQTINPSEIMFVILQKTNQLSPTIVPQNIQNHLKATTLFLDHCNTKFSTLNPLSWLHRYKSFIADVNSHLGLVQDAIQNKIQALVENLAKTLELHYQSRYKQYKSAKKIRGLLQTDLDNFLDICNDIKKFSMSQNSRITNMIDTQFLSEISSKINNLVKNNSNYLNDEIKDKISNLEFVRKYSTVFEIDTQQGRKEDLAWLVDIFTRVTTLVQKKYSALFRYGDRKMTNLMTDASSQLQHFFLSSFRQVQRQPPLDGDAFKRKMVLLLTRLEEIENLEVPEGEATSILSPSQLVTKLLKYSSNQLDPSLSIFNHKLINDVNETSLVLDLVENWNQNMNNISIQNQNSLIPVTNQSLWLVNFKKFVPIVKRNFNIVSDEVESRISGLFQNLTEVIVSDYALKFERGAQSSLSKNETINFRRSLQENLNAFQEVLENLNTAAFLTNSSNSLHSAASDFVQPAQLESAELVQNILQQLFKMGQCLDLARNYVTVNVQPSNWFIPLHRFVNILNTTVNNPITCTNNFHPDKKVVIVKGTFVSIHQLLGPYNFTCLSPQTENIVIISLHTVYIDSDLIRRSIQPDPAKQLNVAIIAPNWIIVENRTINLNGDHGQSRSALLNPGQNGLPGLPGNNAGDFMGIGSTLITNNNGTSGDNYLQVWASGGDGGGGQSGSNGSSGKDGDNVTLDKIEFEIAQGSSLKNQVRLRKYEPLTLLSGYRNCWLIFDFYRCTEFWFNGTLAEKGQDGGSGGAGGFGGQRGLISVVGSLNFTRAFNSLTATHNRDGNMGPRGNGGHGGRGGVHGFNGKVQIYPGKFDEGFSTDGKKLLQSDPQGVAEDGEGGGRGLNRFGRQTPPKHQYSVAEHSFLVNQFRHYARQNLDNPLLETGLNAFINELDTGELSTTPAPTTALMNEFLDLESQELELQRKNINLLPLYERFSHKISQLLNSNVSSTSTGQVLTVLYTASLSRINSLSSSSIATPITDMTSYLNLAQKNIESFQRKSHNYNALSLIQNITRDHISPITKDIYLAQDFITHEITPDIRRLQTKLDSSVEKLLEEILVLKLRISDETKNLTIIQGLLHDGVTQEARGFTVEKMIQSQSLRRDLALLENKRSGLKIKMIAHQILQVLKTGSHFLCFFGPKGMVISMGLQSGLYGAQSLLGDVKGQEARAIAIYTETTRKFLAKGIRQLAGFVTFLDDTTNKLMTYPSTFSGIIQEISRIKIEANSEKTKLELQLSALDKQDIDINNVNGSREKSPMSLNLLDFIRFKKETIRAMLNSSTKHITNNITNTTMIPPQNAMIALTNLIYEDLQLNTEFYLKVKNNRNKIHELTQTIQENEKELGELEALALTVETRMALILAEFHGKMEPYFSSAVADSSGSENFSENVTFKSAANVEIARWHISRKLRAIKNLIHSKFTKTYQVDDEIMMIFQKMDHAFTMLTQVYDRISQFEKEAKLGYFISRINSIAFQQTSSSAGMLIQDPLMQDKMLRVELGIASRVIVGQYQRVIHSLKMATFPFAEFYLRNIHMPDKLVQLPDPALDLLQNKHSINYNNRNQNRTENQKSSDLLVGELAEEASRILRTISDQVSLSKSTHNDILDHHLRITSFVKSKSSVPFYVWEGSKFGFSIRKLLSGRSVSLTADVRKSPRNYDAVKLSRIDVNFRAGAVTYNDSDESITSLSRSGSGSGDLILKELQNELEHYQIKMTHMGNSAYRYDDKYYTIPSPPVSFTFSFQKDPISGLPTDRNWAHLKWASGDILLSPYATWKMEIAPFDQSRNISILQALAESVDSHVDLELVGRGTYVEKGLGSVLKIDDYYSADEDLSHPHY